MTNISDEMKTQAIGLGLCQQWQDEWADNTTKDELVDKFVRGLDFCIQHDFPTTKVMKECFGDTIHRHGVYVDEKVRTASQSTVILNGECDAEIEYGDFDCARVWVRHNSRANITVNGFAVVKVFVLDKSEVHIKNSSCRKVKVYKYGGCVTCEGDVTIAESADPYKN